MFKSAHTISGQNDLKFFYPLFDSDGQNFVQKTEVWLKIGYNRG